MVLTGAACGGAAANKLGKAGGVALAEALKVNKSLATLDLRGELWAV